MSKCPLTLSTLVICASAAFGQTSQTWNTDVAGSLWSENANWNPSGSPAGNDVIFGDTYGKTANATTVGNIVDQNYTLNSLTYNNTNLAGNPWQVTQINSGVTLTLDSSSASAPSPIFSVGGVAGTSIQMRVAIRGSGALVVNESSSSIYVGGPSSGTSAMLDMSGLSTFQATVTTLNFGGDTSRGTGSVLLADTNVLTASTLNLGTSTGSTSGGAVSALTLGQVNTINISTINVGSNYGGGSIAYRAGLVDATTVIRGTSGGSTRANLNVGTFASIYGVNNAKSGTADFRGGSIDALIDQMKVGTRSESGANLGANATAGFYMKQGTVDANSLVVGRTAYGSGTPTSLGSLTATVGIEGGSFQVNGDVNMAENASGVVPVTASINVSSTGSMSVGGNVTMGTRTGTAATVAANVTVSGGTLLIQGNLAEGTGGDGVTSTVTVSGGTLNMDRGNIAVDSFNFTSGKLKDVASFSAGTTGGLNVQNASTLAYTLDGSFTSLSLAGALTLGAASNLELTLASGFTPGASFVLVANDLLDSISGTFATINGAAFGAGNTFSLTNDMGTFEYGISYTGGDGNDLVISAVPEPVAAFLFIGGLAGLWILRRRAASRS
ncbi:hypothetical protein DB345_19980 [Spartobacteria bacterium LR76]|nr:hypothetical protein DB345_19980 [Spartobacteria bacterium LR76]